MEFLTENEANFLMEKAKEAVALSYAPYSNFNVGAAVLTKSGYVITGANIENASYGLTICAERTALANTLNQGHKDIKAIAVWVAADTAAPCGACRQFIFEFGSDIIIIFRNNGMITQKTIAEILPFGFRLDTK